MIVAGWVLTLQVSWAASPSLSLTTPASASFETENSSLSVEGTANTGATPVGVQWVDRFGQRGSGTVVGAHSWSVADIPLKLGVNLITVTVIDAAGHSASSHLAVNRKLGPGMQPPKPLAIGAGSWKNRPIVYQIWNGRPVVEGDILLKPSTFSAPTKSGESVAAKGIIHPDGLGISYTSQLWPSVGGVYQVPYVVTSLNGGACTGSGSNANLTSAIGTFNKQFTGLIQFVPASGQTNYVNICVAPGGSGEGYSNVGVAGGEQTLECGSGCTVATWLHEMGHTVGLLHEHQRPDRANFINLTLANADLPNVPGNFTLFLYDYQTLGLYDYASVMHYGAFDFSKAGLPVIESIPAGIPLSNNSGYSAGDIDTIERLYGATPTNVTITTNPVGLKFIVDGTTYQGKQTFSFALHSSHTLSVPADPQYESPVDGSTYVFGGWNDQGARSHTITILPGSNTPTSSATEPAVTMYQANFIRLQPFAFASPAAYPSGSGTISVSPTPISEYGGSFFVDRTRVQLTLSSAAGYNLYDWFNLPYPPSDNPHSFYIQSPITSAQAVLEPNATPVTIVGESLTGPNTWNPLLAAYVDNVFTLLPSAFTSVYNPTWTPGSTHTISMVYEESTLQEQSPVTTNVFYDWNEWTDGGAISHTITQPASGSQTVAASFTPFYASYTSPPPLGAANGSCAGGVSTSPTGTTYSNDIFNFYEDGTRVTATATANPTFPSMVFSGWTGSLTGATNPLTTTVDDQFVPTATFNVTSAPLAITSLSPSTAIASSTAPLDVTINGTGFTASNGTTYTYWNGNYRPYTYVSPTQLTLHLAAGDLANVGGQDVYVGNYATVPAPGGSGTQTCGVGAEASFEVAAAPPPADSSMATYMGLDTTTQGTWTGKYGANGYLIANDATNAPAYAGVSLTNDSLTTWAASTADPRALQTASGAATRIASAYYSATSFTVNVNLIDGNAHQVALYLLDWGNSGRTETISILDFATNAVLSTQTFSNFNNGVYAVWNLKGHVLIQVHASGATNGLTSAIFFDPQAAATAAYVGEDLATQGTWTGKYGANGEVIANDVTKLPAYAAVSLTGDTAVTWASPTTDPRALQTTSGASTRIASAYYSATSFTMNVNLTDGNTHQVALYLLDWGKSGRSETISILDANSNAVLSTQTFSNFNNGAYVIWNLKGHVLIQVHALGNTNGLTSAIFFDPPIAGSAIYMGQDTTTEGTWTGKYGSNGEVIANDVTNLPSYATLSFTGATLTTWAGSTTDPRALQTSSGAASRIASTYYSATSFTLNVNLLDGNTHHVALYLLDWGKSGRTETISILDANSNAVLSTQVFSNFNNGTYAVWNLKGHVLIQVQASGATNGLTSGVFFDP